MFGMLIVDSVNASFFLVMQLLNREHAYYLQYKNLRADYVKNIWKIVNWKNVEQRFKEAQG